MGTGLDVVEWEYEPDGWLGDWFCLLTDAEDEEETSSFKEDGIVGADIPSRLPHNRIAAWARELMDDLQSIEDADQTNSTTKENGAEDLGESLAVKR